MRCSALLNSNFPSFLASSGDRSWAVVCLKVARFICSLCALQVNALYFFLQILRQLSATAGFPGWCFGRCLAESFFYTVALASVHMKSEEALLWDSQYYSPMVSISTTAQHRYWGHCN